MSGSPAGNRIGKGILLVGGRGSRMYPLTRSVSKHLLAVYDKPLVYYPLSVLMQAGVRHVLVICSPEHEELYRALLGDGSHLGMRFDYARQPQAAGIAQGLIIAQEQGFLGPGEGVALALGDNLLFGPRLPDLLQQAAAQGQGATVFCLRVDQPQQFGVLGFDAQGRPCQIVEKPSRPPSPYAVIGLYFYDAQAAQVAGSLRPSARGELEITDVNRWYLQRGLLHVRRLGPEFCWLDTGTPDALLQAAQLVAQTQRRLGVKIGCVEEVAFRQGFITADQLLRLAQQMPNAYGQYLRRVATGWPEARAA